MTIEIVAALLHYTWPVKRMRKALSAFTNEKNCKSMEKKKKRNTQWSLGEFFEQDFTVNQPGRPTTHI